MNRKFWQIVSIPLFTLLLMGMAVAMAQGLAPPGDVSLQASHSGDQASSAVPARAEYTYNTVITVTSTSDPDDSSSYTCYTGTGSDRFPCTLRRALVEAGKAVGGDRPVLIKFNVPTSDAGYDGTLDVWKIEPIGDLPYMKGGQVIIDGDTQGEIGGRTDGPKIIVKLYPNDDLTLGYNLSDNDNIVRGLALQEGGISLYGSHNIVEDNWVGLTDDGQTIYYIDDDPRKANYATISGGSSSDNNTIQNNIVASSKGESIAVQGDGNVIVGNYVGTKADGTIDDVPENRRCHPDAVYYNWFTGDGIRVSGDGNRVGGPTEAERNVIAGMLFANPNPHNSPPMALEVTGDDNTVQNNYIGKDANGQEVWVCGMGIYIDGKRNQFLDNAIVNPGEEAIGIYGSAYSLDAITLQGNVIKNAPLAIKFGDLVPLAWKNFNPAKVTQIDGTTVSGTAGDGSPCANCIIELFLDDGDDQVEALQSLITTTAGTDGSWSVELAQTLAPTQGLRTASTTSAWDQIEGFDEGTTSKLSELYPDGVTPPPPPPPPTFPLPPDIPPITPLPTPEPPPTYSTVITVTSTDDPDTSSSYTCYTTPGVGQTAKSPCTLRRAIVEASALDETDRPVLIKFNVPLTDTGYNVTLGVWKIELGGDLPYVKGGQVVIDGETQGEIGGRTDGPKIIVKGSDLTLGYTANEHNNVACGLALQEGGIYLVGDRNIVKDNWVGLTDDGQSIYYVDDDPKKSNYATISGGGDSDNNLIRDNVSASSNIVSIDLQGSDNVVVGNYVGTRANGTLPDVPENKKCRPTAPDNWWTGVGIRISGSRNRVGGPTEAERNVIAGMLFASDNPENLPPEAMAISGDHHVIQNNYIGKDANGDDVWVCGPAIDVLDSEFVQFLDNTMVNAGSYALGIYGSGITLDAITIQGNVIKNVTATIEFGPNVPITWTHFSPARVTSIDGTAVSGTSGSGSPCPYCTVELFLDDDDALVETLQSLITTTADVDGNWAATLPRELTETEGLRTASTTRNFGVIADFEVGTTSDFSKLYTLGFEVYLPVVMRNH